MGVNEKESIFTVNEKKRLSNSYFCPECLKNGHKSRLPISELKGSVMVFCKHCKKSVEINKS